MRSSARLEGVPSKRLQLPSGRRLRLPRHLARQERPSVAIKGIGSPTPLGCFDRLLLCYHYWFRDFD